MMIDTAGSSNATNYLSENNWLKKETAGRLNQWDEAKYVR
jgi:hypothetical protein